MAILETIILLLIIAFAAALLSHGAEIIAEKYGANFAGSIVLALVTTLPEYMFVFWASLKGQYAMAIGSAIGACMMLVTLGYGLVILTATTRINRRPIKMIELSEATRIDAVYLVITALVAFVLAWEGNGFDVKDGIILTVLFIMYVYHLAKGAMKFSNLKIEALPKEKLRKGFLLLLIGGIITIYFSEPFVESMLGLARELGISPVAIAIVVGPIASEMPEKLTAFITVMRNAKLAEISVCNFIGSKVNHNSLLLALVPFIAFTQGNSVHGVVTVQFTAMTLLTFIAGISVTRRKLNVWQGLVFTGLFSVLVSVAWLAR